MDYSEGESIVNDLYCKHLKRYPDEQALITYVQKLINYEISEHDLEEILLTSDEYKSLNIDVQSSTLELLNMIFLKTLGRLPDKDAKKSYLQKLEAKIISEKEIIQILKNSDEFSHNKNANYNIYNNFCITIRNHYNENNINNLCSFPLNNKFCCFIAEGRKDSHIDVMIYLTMTFIPVQTKLFILCNYDNINNIKKSLYKFDYNIEYIIVNKLDNFQDYNKLMLDVHTYDTMISQGFVSCLIFQSDSFIYKDDIMKYVYDIERNYYDQIGSIHLYNDGSYIYNGGLVLRNLKVMKKLLLQNYKSSECSEDMNEDEFFSEYAINAKYDYGLNFSIEHDYNHDLTKILGVHKTWSYLKEDSLRRIFDLVYSNLNIDINNLKTKEYMINECYKRILEREVDQNGLQNYIHMINNSDDISILEEILFSSDEYKHLQETKQYYKNIMSCYITPQYSNVYHGILFDVVLCRYNENIDFVKYFEKYPCKVYLYNKGSSINQQISMNNLVIIDIPNIAYEDYTYAKHINTNYVNLAKNTLFMQCNLDHIPDLFRILDDFENFGDFVSMSKSTGVKSFNNTQFTIENTNQGIFMQIDSMEFDNILEILGKKHSQDFKSPFEYIKYMGFFIYNDIKFVPGAQFYNSKNNIVQYDQSVYSNMMNDITYIYDKYNYLSKKFAEMLERYLWSSVWSLI